MSYGGTNYGLGKWLLDVFMTCITFGLWLIFVFVREVRKNALVRRGN